MEEILYTWLESAFHRCQVDETLIASELSMSDKILTVGRNIFSLIDNSSFDDIYDAISTHFNREIPYTLFQSQLFIIEALLIVGVSSSCIQRSSFVELIMTLDLDQQKNIMNSIKNNLYHFFDSLPIEEIVISEEKSCDTSHADQINDCEESLDKSNRDDQRFENTFIDHQRVSCRQCDDNQIRSNKLSKEIEMFSIRENEYKEKMRSEMTIITNKLMDAEIAIINKDEMYTQQCIIVDELSNKVLELEGKLKCNEHVQAQFQTLQDEIDVLKPKAERLDITELRVEKMRSRLEDLKNVKEQLQVESTSHTVTHNKLLEMEQEVESLRYTKSQLEEYRIRNVEYSLQVEELIMELKQRDKDINEWKNQCKLLREYEEGYKENNQHLYKELRAFEEQVRDNSIKREGGIGDGISELNPALSQELAKLRKQNVSLQEQIDESSIASLESLKQTIADQNCIKVNLQEKWMKTKEALSQSQNELTIAKFEITKQGIHIDRIQECMAMKSEDYHMKQNINLQINSHNFKKFQSQIFLLITGYEASMADMKSKWDTTTSELEFTRIRESELIELKLDLLNQLDIMTNNVNGAIKSQQDNMVANQETIEKMVFDHTEKLRMIEEEYNRRICDKTRPL